jgi:hypothetical protein
MKFLIVISNRLRSGQYPRLPDFKYNEVHGVWCYQGSELTAEEFTAASSKVFDPNYRGQGFVFRPVIIAKPAKKQAVKSEDAKPEKSDPTEQ